MNAPATNAWSVINMMRRYGATTKAAVLTAWLAVETVPGNVTLPVSGDVDDGVNYLVANGFATFDGTTITASHIGTDGKPARLRRVPGNEFALEYLPDGASPREGT